MTIKIPTVEELIEINSYANRRLRLAIRKKKKEIFIDNEDNEIKAEPFGFPGIVCAARVENPYEEKWDEEDYERPYKISSVKPNFHGYLTRQEAKLVLGKDDYFEITTEDLNAMLIATLGGPNSSNAYVLGERCMGIHEGKNITVIPTQYYKISDKRHKELGVKNSENKLSYLIGCIERERKKTIK